MNFENQGVIKRLADQYGPENLTVVLGNGEANGVEVFAETVTEGDPSFAGPLAGVALKIPVYHVLEADVMGQVPEALRDEKLQLSALVIDIEPMHQVLEASRAKALKPFQGFKWFQKFQRSFRIPTGTLGTIEPLERLLSRYSPLINPESSSSFTNRVSM